MPPRVRGEARFKHGNRNKTNRKEEMLANSKMRGQSSSQGLPGLCETWMSNTSLQGCIHGVSRQALTAALAGEVHCQATTLKPSKFTASGAALPCTFTRQQNSTTHPPPPPNQSHPPHSAPWHASAGSSADLPPARPYWQHAPPGPFARRWMYFRPSCEVVFVVLERHGCHRSMLVRDRFQPPWEAPVTGHRQSPC